MIDFFSKWYQRYFSHPEAVLLALFVLMGALGISYFGMMLAPVLASIVIAYLLEGTVQALQQRNMPRIVAVCIVFTVFLAVLVFLVVGLVPTLSTQISNFLQELPRMVTKGREVLLTLPESYPQLISANQVDQLINGIREALTSIGQNVLSVSLASLTTLITLLVYLILGPVLVFFFLKDKDLIRGWLSAFLPRERTVLNQVWREMDEQIGNYVRGKVYEIFIVGSVTYSVFAILGLNFAPLLAVLVGLSVIVPYIGAAVVTVPVALAAYVQMGLGPDFYWIMGAYFVLQALDGNLLVPLLFSDVVNLHPVAIIVAVLVFGGLWGFWGVFFAIPLATLVKSLLNAWPQASAIESPENATATS